MNKFWSLLKADLMANKNSAKGQVVMILFRVGQLLPYPLRRIYRLFYYVLVDIFMGISIPFETHIDGGFTLRHGQGVVVSWKSTIGSDCEVHQGVTIGEKNGAAPQLGANVTIGANAVILGGIRVGNGAYIGAGAVVTKDVPPGAVAIGIAATYR